MRARAFEGYLIRRRETSPQIALRAEIHFPVYPAPRRVERERQFVRSGTPDSPPSVPDGDGNLLDKIETIAEKVRISL